MCECAECWLFRIQNTIKCTYDPKCNRHTHVRTMLCYNIIALFDCIASFRLFEAHIRKSFTEWYKCARWEAASNWVPKNDLLFTLPLILSLSHYLLYVTSNGYFFIASGWFSLSCHHPFILTKIFTSPSSLWLIWTELNWTESKLRGFFGNFLFGFVISEFQVYDTNWIHFEDGFFLSLAPTHMHAKIIVITTITTTRRSSNNTKQKCSTVQYRALWPLCVRACVISM